MSPSCENLEGKEKGVERGEAGTTSTAYLTNRNAVNRGLGRRLTHKEEPVDAIIALSGIHLYHLGKYPWYPSDSLYLRLSRQ